MKSNILVKKITISAMFIALSYVLTLVAHYLHLTLVPNIQFLTYDPKDIIICIAGFVLGPYVAMGISVGVSFIEMITISQTGFYGFIMNIFSTCALVVPASFVYHYRKNFFTAILALFAGYVSALMMMSIWNIIITPIYMDIDRNVMVDEFLIPIVLFNIIKVGINVGCILLLYKPIVRILRFTNLLQKSENDKSSFKNTLIMLCIGVILIIGFVVCIILLNNK